MHLERRIGIGGRGRRREQLAVQRVIGPAEAARGIERGRDEAGRAADVEMRAASNAPIVSASGSPRRGSPPSNQQRAWANAATSSR
ncbi:hypothetical protein [Burkholderia gladioli]|uniref:hypothetical protein n=1 Tax=Burkholderia gladioli TaxID=28095 RepID=UPI003D24F662